MLQLKNISSIRPLGALLLLCCMIGGLSYNIALSSVDHKHRIFHSSRLYQTEDSSVDLINRGLLCYYSGFGASNMPCKIILQENNKVVFSGGFAAIKPGFWRILSKDDGFYIEMTVSVTPEFMLTQDLWDPNLCWQAKLNENRTKLIDGVIQATTRSLVFFSKTDNVATFEGDIFPSSSALPTIDYPKFEDQMFVPPEDFFSPNDMKRFPEIFSKEFVEWWFDVEDAVARGTMPPPRQKAFFVPSRKTFENAKASGAKVYRDDTRKDPNKVAGFRNKNKEV